MTDVIEWLESAGGMAWSRDRHDEIHWGTGIFAALKDDGCESEWEYGTGCYQPQWETGRIYVGGIGASIDVDPAITDLPSPA